MAKQTPGVTTGGCLSGGDVTVRTGVVRLKLLDHELTTHIKIAQLGLQRLLFFV